MLDFGQRIAAGPPAQALRDPRVIDAYLGPDFAARLAAEHPIVNDRKGDPA